MIDLECRDALKNIMQTIETLVAQVNEATISAHSIRMAIAEVNPKMTVRIRKQYLRLEKSSKPLVADMNAAIRGLARTLDVVSKDVN